jgi:hypothetical protein
VTRLAIQIARQIRDRKHPGHSTLADQNREEILQGILDVPKRADLRQRQGKIPRRREVLTDPGERLAKFAIETGYDIRHDHFLAEPLEEWTCPDKNLGKIAYKDLMVWGREFRLDGLDPRDREIWTWALNEQLAAVDQHGVIVPLSDAAPPSVRSYPGAPAPDQRAGVGRQLREQAVGLMLAAFANLSRGMSVVRSKARRKRGKITGDGIMLTAAALASEANAIKARRTDLEGYRYLSLSTCRRLIRFLIGAGVLDEISSPKPTRRRRSWAMRPRVLRRMTEVPECAPTLSGLLSRSP